MNQNIVVFDLDHTLIKTDLLQEQMLMVLKKNPLNIFLIFFALFKGRVALKYLLESMAPIDPSTLPYNNDVIELAKKLKSEGKKIILVSASVDSEVKKIANHLGIFDEAHGTTNTNLRGKNKVDFIKSRLNHYQWSYVGDSFVDLPIWKESQIAFLVQPSANLISEVKKQNPNKTIVILSHKINFIKTYLKGIRAHQWVKNILVFSPLILAHKFTDPFILSQSLLSFFLFSFVASSIYILNDLFDLSSDRLHIKKRHRPWASGDLGIIFGIINFAFFSIVAFYVAFSCDKSSGLLLLSYFILNLLYTFKLKSLLLIDVILLALMYNLRIIFGGLMTDIPISPWLLTFSVFFFLGLAFIKRFAELKKHTESSKQNTRAYQIEDQSIIAVIGVASSLLSVLVFALYLNSPAVLNLYHNNHFLWLITPALLYWVSRVWILVYRGILDDDPIAFAIKDKATYMVGLFIISILLFSI